MKDIDRAVDEWLSNHHAVVDRGSALALGMSRRQISEKVRTGAWIPVYPGVYRLAAVPLTSIVRHQAAVLLGGEGAVVSHESAAWLHGLRPFPPDEPTITVPRGRVIRVVGVRSVRSRHPASGFRKRGLVCTDIPRTTLDCAGVLDDQAIDDLIDTALARNRVRLESIAKIATTSELRCHPGRVRLRRRLAARGFTGSPTPSVLESRMARLLKRHRLPVAKPQLLAGPVGKYRLDYAYSAVRLVVEVDGQFEHGKIQRQRRDRRRDADLQAAGWTVLHYDWWEVTFEAERVAAEIAAHYRRLEQAA